MEALRQKLTKMKEEGLQRTAAKQKERFLYLTEMSRAKAQQKKLKKLQELKEVELFKLAREVCQGRHLEIKLEKCDHRKRNFRQRNKDQHFHESLSDHSSDISEPEEDSVDSDYEPSNSEDDNGFEKEVERSGSSDTDCVASSSEDDEGLKKEVQSKISSSNKWAQPVLVLQRCKNPRLSLTQSAEKVGKAKAEAYLNDFKKIPLVILERNDWCGKRKIILHSQLGNENKDKLPAGQKSNCETRFRTIKKQKNLSIENYPPTNSDIDECEVVKRTSNRLSSRKEEKRADKFSSRTGVQNLRSYRRQGPK
nr:PREDICTED: uncharacterized protein LOC109030814 isoform X1 [Bemisia tabaci]XP_018897523.1 PREDICTED: uncharacterized protein LOC109030814 isoform X1 [Bemisia tabaci]